MFWTVVILVTIVLVLAWLMFQSISVWIPANKDHKPDRELNEVEDLRQYPMDDNLDLKVHYHAKEEDTI
jgi:hypothetical protein